MLKEILSIGGKPGLFKLVSQGKNMLIVESLVDSKRIPAYSHDKVVSLGDVAIFTETDEIPLAEVLENIKKKENGAAASIDTKADNDVLRKYMSEVLPEYDRERVYPSDIRKLISWYNILVSKNITDFSTKEEEKTEEITETETVKETVKAKKTTTPKTAAPKAPKGAASAKAAGAPQKSTRAKKG